MMRHAKQIQNLKPQPFHLQGTIFFHFIAKVFSKINWRPFPNQQFLISSPIPIFTTDSYLMVRLPTLRCRRGSRADSQGFVISSRTEGAMYVKPWKQIQKLSCLKITTTSTFPPNFLCIKLNKASRKQKQRSQICQCIMEYNTKNQISRNLGPSKICISADKI